jgi:hypothetical protein
VSARGDGHAALLVALMLTGTASVDELVAHAAGDAPSTPTRSRFPMPKCSRRCSRSASADERRRCRRDCTRRVRDVHRAGLAVPGEPVGCVLLRPGSGGGTQRLAPRGNVQGCVM